MLNSKKRILYMFYSVLAYLIPMAILVGVRHSVYFKTPKTSFTFMFIIVAIVVLFVLRKKIFKNTTIDLIIGHIVVILLLQFPQAIINELSLVLSVSVIGLVLSAVFGRVEQFYADNSHTVLNGCKRLNSDCIPDKVAWAEAYGFLACQHEQEKGGE